MELVLLETTSPEWNKAWDWVAKHPINEGIDTPDLALNNGEAWQYMGSYKQNDVVISQFRHRDHPRTKGYYSLTYKHEAFDHKDITKKFKL